MEQDRTADTAALPFTSDAGDLADASHKIGDLRIEERDHISYTRERILQIREDIEISEDILKVKQLIEAEFDDTKSEDLHFHGRERICYKIDQLLRLQKVAKIPEDILKIKKELDVETKHPAPSTPSDLIAKAGRLIQQEQMVKYPQRPGELECLYFKKYGTCGFRSACRFHHPSPSALGDPTMDGDDGAHRQEKMEYCEISGQPECPSFMEFGSCNFGATCKYHHPKDHLPIMASCNISPNGLPFTPASASPFSDLSGSPPESDNLVQQRAQMEDCTWSRGQSECTYFMKFGTCKFGSTCKYKHIQSSARTGSSLADGPIQRPTHMDYTEMRHQSDCPYLMEFGTCKFGPACKYQHRRPLASNYCTSQTDSPIPRPSQMEEYSLSPEEPVCSYFIKHGTCKFESACNFYHPSPSTLSYLTTKADGLIHHEGQLGEYPQRPGEPECSYFIKHGTCKFESACKFHHPSPSTLSYLTTEADGPIHHEGQLDEYPQRPGEPECSYFMKHGTCKFRYTCKFHHPAPSTLSGLVDDPVHWEQMEEYPQRPGEPECSYFIKYGTCKFRYSCKFHHPAPSTIGCLTVKVDDPVHQERMEEYPQRPGVPECSYFIKYGTCKFESACKFHHPSLTTLGGLTTEANGWVRHQGHVGQSEITGEADCLPTVPLCIISPAGLPLRPGRPSCSYYSRFGTCKFGPQCRFDHPYG